MPFQLNEIKNKQIRERLRRVAKTKKNKEAFQARKSQKADRERGICTEPPKQPHTIDSRRVPNENVCDPQDEDLLASYQTDEFSGYFSASADPSYQPKILVTTSRENGKQTRKFADALVDLIPKSEFIERKHSHSTAEILSGATERGFTDVVIIGESAKQPVFLSIVHLPEGPTSYFRLSSVRYAKQMTGHGNATDHNPELILNNFTTRLGLTIGKQLACLFPKSPEFRGRQVVTFHCQRDFIFLRRHRYQIEATSEEIQEIQPDKKQKVALQEIGPRFTCKLIALQKGLYNRKDGVFEFLQPPNLQQHRRKFHL